MSTILTGIVMVALLLVSHFDKNTLPPIYDVMDIVPVTTDTEQDSKKNAFDDDRIEDGNSIIEVGGETEENKPSPKENNVEIMWE